MLAQKKISIVLEGKDHFKIICFLQCMLPYRLHRLVWMGSWTHREWEVGQLLVE